MTACTICPVAALKLLFFTGAREHVLQMSAAWWAEVEAEAGSDGDGATPLEATAGGAGMGAAAPNADEGNG